MYTEAIYEHILPLDKSLNPEGWVPPFATRYYFSGGSRIFQMGGAVLSQMGGRTSCFQVKSA